MRLAWFKRLSPNIQLLVLLGLLFVLTGCYICLSRCIKPAAVSLLSLPLRLCEGVSSGAREFLSFQNLLEENKALRNKVDGLTSRLNQLQEVSLENQRLRQLISLPQQESLRTQAALLIARDSSNWTNTVSINKGTSNGIREGMPVVLGANLVGRVIETASSLSKVALLTDFNSKVPAKILRTREEGLVFGAFAGRRNTCGLKYVQEPKVGDKVISSGLGGIYPKGLLIGKVLKVEAEESQLYQIAEIQPAVDLSRLEEVMVIIDQEKY